jgi:hypothetical protein
MTPVRPEHTVKDHFTVKVPALRALDDRLLAIAGEFGPIQERASKTSIQLVRGSALAGVEVRKDCRLLNLKSDHRIDSPRLEKAEQIPAGGFHHRFRIRSIDDLDPELRKWLTEAHALSGGRGEA